MKRIRRLDVGGGSNKRIGYDSVDIEDHGNNIVGDFRDMTFSDLSIVRSFFLLEHYGRKDAIEVLQQWHSWIKYGGFLWIAVPDLEEVCKKFAINPYWMSRHLFGSQEADWAFHLDGWWEDKLRQLLPAIGFEITELNRFITRKYLPNIEVLAKKVKPNPEALKKYLKKYPNNI